MPTHLTVGRGGTNVAPGYLTIEFTDINGDTVTVKFNGYVAMSEAAAVLANVRDEEDRMWRAHLRRVEIEREQNHPHDLYDADDDYVWPDSIGLEVNEQWEVA